MVRSTVNDHCSVCADVIAASRQRNSRRAPDGPATPAPSHPMDGSVPEHICTMMPPFSPGVCTNDVTNTAIRIPTGEGASTSSSVPPPHLQQLEEIEEEQIGLQPPTPEAAALSSPGGDGSADMPLILTEAAVLNCPICTLPLCIPVYQCAEGHIACETCNHEIRQQNESCPYCRLPSEFYRCRAIEQVLESVKASCCYRPQGCQATFSFDAKRAHEQDCCYALCPCPGVRCCYVGKYKQLYAHFASHHGSSAKKFLFGTPITISLRTREKRMLLQERNEKILFFLCNSAGKRGNGFAVVCIAPGSSTRIFPFDLKASNGASTVTLKSYAENRTEMVHELAEPVYLRVPRCFATLCGIYTVELTIWDQAE